MLASASGRHRCGEAAARQGRRRQREGADARTRRRRCSRPLPTGRGVITLLANRRRGPHGDDQGRRPDNLDRELVGRRTVRQPGTAAAGRRRQAARRRKRAGAAGAERARRRARRRARPASIGSIQLNELVVHAGRHDAAAPRGAPGLHSTPSRALLDAGADVNQGSAGRQHQPAAHRHASTATSISRRCCSITARTRIWPRTTARRRSMPRSTASGRRSRSIRSRART